jgi:hypothetical protein
VIPFSERKHFFKWVVVVGVLGEFEAEAAEAFVGGLFYSIAPSVCQGIIDSPVVFDCGAAGV